MIIMLQDVISANRLPVLEKNPVLTSLILTMPTSDLIQKFPNKAYDLRDHA